MTQTVIRQDAAAGPTLQEDLMVATQRYLLLRAATTCTTGGLALAVVIACNTPFVANVAVIVAVILALAELVIAITGMTRR